MWSWSVISCLYSRSLYESVDLNFDWLYMIYLQKQSLSVRERGFKLATLQAAAYNLRRSLYESVDLNRSTI